ncbi:HNH endonuclease [Lysobacter enzymogenes]|uniref:HNH endonuclease n=1 Tax=Lysobacter enzymogenes TaxID=69 RepID=UPI003747C50D
MPNLQRLRERAFVAQQGRCCYCGRAMWLQSPSELDLQPPRTMSRQCTAEHLIARHEGGRSTRENIAAACWLCNQRRHRRRRPLSPDAFRELVAERIAKGRWC